MDPRTALLAAAALVALAVFAGWRGARLPNPQKGPRMIPWRWIMLLSATAAILVLLELALEMKGP
jgi:hypothetical protein